jgi:glycosyltransferase involved in cell wall biosynthesis
LNIQRPDDCRLDTGILSQSEKVPLSVLIPTRNEERNLVACLKSVDWADEIIVFDSHSTDGTLDMARAAGATILQKDFDNFAAHKNWALDNIDFRHGWVLLIDADERITEPLADEIKAAVAPAAGPVAGYYIARQTLFCGRWIRHGGVYPDYNLRLLRRGSGRFEDRLVHEHIILDGAVGYFKHHLVHDDDKGFERYLERHNHYTSLEAVEIVRRRRGLLQRTTLDGDLSMVGPARRRWLKNFAQRWLPCRPLCVFLYMYVLKAGFLDGRMGLRYCFLKMFFEYQIAIKVRELDDPQSSLYRRYKAFLE